MGAGYTALGSGVGSLLQDRPDCPSSFRVLPCLHKKLPELDLYPPPCLSQTPPFSHPSPNGHAFQERKRVHQGLSAQMQWPAPQSAGTSLTDMKQNCFMADDSLPRGGCGLTHPGELAAPQRGPLWTLPSAAWGTEGRLWAHPPGGTCRSPERTAVDAAVSCVGRRGAAAQPADPASPTKEGVRRLEARGGQDVQTQT